MKPLLLSVNPDYFYRILDWQKKSYTLIHGGLLLIGDLARVDGFDQYNHLIDLNSVFSTNPTGDPVDRTQTYQGPFNFHVQRPWQVPEKSVTLDNVIERRVRHYQELNQQLNLCWSGGIDSTCILAGFLQHTPHLAQLRVLYTPFSIYENPEFYNHVRTRFPQLEMLDISGDVYLKNKFDGVMINGHGGDEFTASLDESFFDLLGSEGLHGPWQDYVYKTTSNQNLIDFCEQFFTLARRPITTVLQARWWFYAATKSQVYAPRDGMFSTTATTSAFFDCQEFEDYMWHNTDQIIAPGEDYRKYKQFLKQYIYEFDHNLDRCNTAQKVTSEQFILYTRKKITLAGQQWIARLSDGTQICTPNLPLFSQLEFNNKYGRSLDYLFNYTL